MSTQVNLSDSSLMLTFYSFTFLKVLISINFSDYHLYQISQIQMQFNSGTSSSNYKNASIFCINLIAKQEHSSIGNHTKF